MADTTALLEKLKKREDNAKEIRAKLKSVKELEKDIELDVKVIDEEVDEEEDIIEEPKHNFSESVNVECRLLEKQINEKKRTVVAGVLQENTLSANNRFYPANIVRSAIESLPGKRALIGHESDNAEDVVAKISRSFMKNGIGFAEFKFGTDDKSERIFSKIKEGLIDSTSIRASGTTKRGKIDGNYVDVVEELEVASVDWVVEGGVSAAKVSRVFENAPSINFNHNKENEEMEKLELLQKQLDEQKKQMDELLKVNEGLKKESEESKAKLDEQKLETYKESKLASIPDEEIRAMVKEQLIGKDEKSIDEQFARQIKYHEAIREKAGIKSSEVRIIPTDKNEEDEEIKVHNVNEFLESKRIPKKEKFEALVSLMG